MVKIKICGLTREEDIISANGLLPDYIGFVFAKKSRRCISPKQAARLRAMLDGRINAVGVFVDEPIENVLRLIEDGVIDTVQLHGRENEEYLSELRKFTERPIIKAFGISSREDAEAAEGSGADFILLDNVVAGSGRPFDRTLLRTVKRDFFLAGGLTPSTVEDAIKTYVPYAVDVSSGVETDGFKDKNKMREFVSRVRSIEV